MCWLALFVGLLVASSSGGSAAPPAKKGLVASYGFNESASKGLKFGDFSGKKNGATGHGVRRVKGKFAKGLYFNGKSSWVTVPDRASLDLTGRMTLEAWVKPQAGSGKRTILAKLGRGSTAYALNAATYKGGAGGVAGIGGPKSVTTADDLPLGTWTHIALTYDGASLRLFYNGAQVGTTSSVTGKIANGRGPLRIGGNFIGGGWFKGVIDEVRIYDRTLAVAEIQKDMRRSAGPARNSQARSGSGPGGRHAGTLRIRHRVHARRGAHRRRAQARGAPHPHRVPDRRRHRLHGGVRGPGGLAGGRGDPARGLRGAHPQHRGGPEPGGVGQALRPRRDLLGRPVRRRLRGRGTSSSATRPATDTRARSRTAATTRAGPRRRSTRSRPPTRGWASWCRPTTPTSTRAPG